MSLQSTQTAVFTQFITQPANGSFVIINGMEYIRPFWPTTIEAILHFYDSYTVFLECIAEMCSFTKTDVFRIRIQGDATPKDIVMYWRNGACVASRYNGGRYDDMGAIQLVSVFGHDSIDKYKWNPLLE
jgi:hypothetical protein